MVFSPCLALEHMPLIVRISFLAFPFDSLQESSFLGGITGHPEPSENEFSPNGRIELQRAAEWSRF
jgi:hypothetical protein